MQATEQNINDLQNKIWYVIKQEEGSNTNPTSPNLSTSTNDAYDIKINDIIKLGRVIQSIDKDVDQPVFNLICDYK
jgi:hypothetical protein